MQRISISPRNDWKQYVEKYGLVWHSTDEYNYWNESAYYSFSQYEIDKIKKATKQIYEMYLEAGDYIISRDLFRQFGIPDWCKNVIIDTWNNEPPCLNYGRFDFGFDGENLKLLEFNCDTPTSLLEASIIQWYWKEDVFPDKRQFNEIHEALVEKFADIKNIIKREKLHFAYFSEDSGEDLINVSYLMDCAIEAGVSSEILNIEDVGWHKKSYFVDEKDELIRNLFKLYPWEWMVHEEFGPKILQTSIKTNYLEPIWKMLWSNKAILAILHKLFPNSEYILAADFKPVLVAKFVKKPIHSREGANIKIFNHSEILHQSSGNYFGDAIYQEFFNIPEYGGKFPIIGSWIVDAYPAGIGIREGGIITDNMASFVPHIIE